MADCESAIASEIPGLFLACGHEGDGITLAAVTSEIIADKVGAYLNA